MQLHNPRSKAVPRVFADAAGGENEKLGYGQFEMAVRALARIRFPGAPAEEQWRKAVALVKLMCPDPAHGPPLQVRSGRCGGFAASVELGRSCVIRASGGGYVPEDA